MRSIGARFKNWMGQMNTLGMIRILQAAEDPVAALHAYEHYIDDKLITALLDYSFQMAQAESIDSGLAWLELARQASLLRASPAALADCYDGKALLLLMAYENASADTVTSTSPDMSMLLDAALADAQEALHLYRDLHRPLDVRQVHGHISAIFRAMQQPLPAFQHRVWGVVVGAELPDEAGDLPQLINNLVDEHWELETKDLQRGAEILVEHVDLWQRLATEALEPKLAGDLFDIIGRSYTELEQPESAFRFWERALQWYKEIDSRKDQFDLWGQMQVYALQLDQWEKVVEYGQQSISIAPENLVLNGRYHLLAIGYKELGRYTEAIAAYDHAVGLYAQQGHSAAILLEAATFKYKIGMVDQAIADLQQVLTVPGGTYTFWRADMMLALLLWQHCGNLGKALAHAEQALESTIASGLDFTLRAESLHLSGILHFAAGNTIKALNRWEALLELLKTDLSVTNISFSPLFGHMVLPPAKPEVLLMAVLSCERLGRTVEARVYFEAFQSVASLERDWVLPAELRDLLQADPHLMDPLRAVQYLAQGDQLVYSDPEQAIPLLEQAVVLLEAAQSMDYAARAYRALGMSTLMSSGDLERAELYFHQALQRLDQSANMNEELTCRLQLGLIAISRGDLAAGYTYLSRATQIIESLRISLAEVDQRMFFLQHHLHVYGYLIGICLRLGRFAEALEAVEKVKSRELIDLLFQPEKKPIEYPSLHQLRDLQSAREAWIDELVAVERRPFADSSDESLSEEMRLLERSIAINERTETVQAQLQTRQRFFQLESQMIAPSFVEIRELCRLA